MTNTEGSAPEIIHVQKCGGIPKYPAEYVFDMERPESITDEQIMASKKRVCDFLKEYGVDMSVDDLPY
jgi:hypothetical protein